MAFHGDLPAEKYQALNSTLTVTASQIQQASKHHDKEIQQDEGRWSEATVWEERAEHTTEDRRVSNLFGNGECN